MPAKPGFEPKWWSQAWLDNLTAVDPARMQRGRYYAQSAKISRFEIQPTHVRGRVRGSRGQLYTSEIHFAPCDAPTAAALRHCAAHWPWLQGQDLPDEWEGYLAELDLSLIPDPELALRFVCTCPDWVAPCKHTLALACILSDSLERDPELILSLQGLALNTAAAEPELLPPLDLRHPQFWGRPLERVLELSLPDKQSHVLSRLGTMPTSYIARKRLGEALDPPYDQAAAEAARLLAEMLSHSLKARQSEADEEA